jgi:hypothetical protein
MSPKEKQTPKLVNEQVLAGNKAWAYKADNMEFRRASIGGEMTFDIREVNELVLGAKELSGKATGFDHDSKEMSTKSAAQKRISMQLKVSNEAIGELAGQQTNMSIDAMDVVRARTAPRPHISGDAFRLEMVTPGPDGADARTLSTPAPGWEPDDWDLDHEVPKGFGDAVEEYDSDEELDTTSALKALTKVYRSAEAAANKNDAMRYIPPARGFTKEQLRTKVTEHEVFLAIGTLGTFNVKNAAPGTLADMFAGLKVNEFGKCTVQHMIGTYPPDKMAKQTLESRAAAVATRRATRLADQERIKVAGQQLKIATEMAEAAAIIQAAESQKVARSAFVGMEAAKKKNPHM